MTADVRPTSLRMMATGAGGLIATGLASGVWSGLFAANLATTPALPWSAPAMLVILALAWMYADGRGPPQRTQASRRASLRATGIDRRAFVLALVAGGCGLIALTGVWIVLFQTGAMRGNGVPDFSQFPPQTVIAVVVTAAVMGAVTEEGAFRGYAQGLFERRWPPLVAIVASALLVAPGHAATQGFALPTFVFYLLVDVMLGVTAFLCESILPGIAIHATGLAAFFAWIWPNDPTRVIGAAAWSEP